MEQTVNCILVIMDQTCDYPEFRKYLRKLRVRYPEAEVMTFSPSSYDKSEARRRENYKELLNTYGEDTRFAIHAQGAVGAMIAFEILNFEPERIDTVLFIGGAGASNMHFIERWTRRFKLLKPSLKKQERLMYREALRWEPHIVCICLSNYKTSQIKYWLAHRDTKCYYIPEGHHAHNAYKSEPAMQQWYDLGVRCCLSPAQIFDVASFAPLNSLMRTLDKVDSGQEW